MRTATDRMMDYIMDRINALEEENHDLKIELERKNKLLENCDALIDRTNEMTEHQDRLLEVIAKHIERRAYISSFDGELNHYYTSNTINENTDDFKWFEELVVDYKEDVKSWEDVDLELKKGF